MSAFVSWGSSCRVMVGQVDTHKYSIQCFWVMRSGQYTGVLHVCFQIPKLGQTHAGDIDNVGRIRDRDFGVGTFEGRDKGHDKIQQILIEGEQRDQFCGCREGLVVRKAVLVCLRLFLIFGDVLSIQTFDVIDVDGDASSVAVARPLRILFRRCSACDSTLGA